MFPLYGKTNIPKISFPRQSLFLLFHRFPSHTFSFVFHFLLLEALHCCTYLLCLLSVSCSSTFWKETNQSSIQHSKCACTMDLVRKIQFLCYILFLAVPNISLFLNSSWALNCCFQGTSYCNIHLSNQSSLEVYVPFPTCIPPHLSTLSFLTRSLKRES